MNAMVERSKSAPLYLRQRFVSDHDLDMLDSVKNVISGHFNRVAELDLIGGWKTISSIVHLLIKPAPRLEVLKLRLTDSHHVSTSAEQDLFFPSRLFSNDASHLHHLILVSCPFSFDSLLPICSHLTHLEISRPPIPSRGLPVLEGHRHTILLSALATMPKLQSLILHDEVSSDFHIPQPMNQSIIYLPHLSRLSVSTSSLTVCVGFMQRLHIPGVEFLELKSTIRDACEFEGRCLQDLLFGSQGVRALSTPFSLLEMTRNSRYFRWNCYTVEQGLNSFDSFDKNRLAVSAKFSISLLCRDSRFPTRVLATISEALPLDEVEVLLVHSAETEHQNEIPWLWMCCGQMTEVRTLRFSGVGLLSLTRALILSERFDPKLGLHTPLKSEFVLFPKLCSLRYCCDSWTRIDITNYEPFSLCPPYLKARCDHEDSQLQELDIDRMLLANPEWKTFIHESMLDIQIIAWDEDDDIYIPVLEP